MEVEIKTKEERFSREIHILTPSGIDHLHQAKILVFGLRGVGFEVAKNLILAGIDHITLCDDSKVELKDFSSNYLLKESNIGSSRSKSMKVPLSQLNSSSTVQVISEDSLSSEILAHYNIMISCDQTTNKQIEHNNICRKANVNYISADALGIMTRIFVDCPTSPLFYDFNGEPLKWGYISNITLGDQIVVAVPEECPHGLSDGDKVIFQNVLGLNINGLDPVTVKVTGKHTFTVALDNVANIGTNHQVGTGKFLEVKAKRPFKFLPLPQQDSQMPDSYQQSLHLLYSSIQNWRSNHGRFPLSYSNEEALQIINDCASKIKYIEHEILWNLARSSGCQTSPICSYLGGKVSFEAIKIITSLGNPILQTRYQYFFNCFPNDFKPGMDLNIFKPQNTIYDDIVGIFGINFLNKISKMRTLIAGVGGIGDEMVKNLALLGVQNICITDPAQVIESDLNRHCLLSEQSIGQTKVHTISKNLSSLRPNIKCQPLVETIASGNHIFSDDFFDNTDMIISCVPNDSTRMFLSEQAMYYGKPLVDGIVNMSICQSQIMVPFESDTISRLPSDPMYMHCAIDNFPHKPDHALHFAQNIYNEHFIENVEHLVKYVSEGNKYIDELKSNPPATLQVLKTIVEYTVTSRPNTFDDCIVWARLLFENYFNNRIKHLLYNKPPDTRIANGDLFWSGCNQLPSSINFNVSDPTHMRFILSAANLRAASFGLPGQSNPTNFVNILNNVKIPVYVPSQSKIVTSDEESAKNEEEDEDENNENEATPVESVDINTEIDQYFKKLPTISSLSSFHFTIQPIKDLDQYSNYRLQFLESCTNLRCRNYSIPESPSWDIQLMLKQLKPNISSFCSVVSSLCLFEIIKYIQNLPFVNFVNTDLNLLTQQEKLTEPKPSVKTPAPMKGGKIWNWSFWDRIDINIGDITLQEFLDYFMDKYGWEIQMLSCGASLLYTCFGKCKHLKKPVSVAYTDITKKQYHDTEHYLVLQACVCDETGEEVDIPTIRYKFR